MSPNPWPNLKDIHVFVIDDNEDSRRLLEQALTYCGALVTVFQSAVAALEAMDEYLPTLLISDISMPGMTGLEFVRHLRARRPEKGGLIPAIAITAYYEDFAALSARAAGFDAYLPKPMNFVTSCILVEHLAGLTRPADQPRDCARHDFRGCRDGRIAPVAAVTRHDGGRPQTLIADRRHAEAQ